jgi:hypothetical protein
MSFIVSNGFNSYETMEGVTLLELFQRLKPIVLKPALNQQPKSSCSTVSVVSYIIHSVNETEKVFRRCLKARVQQHIDLQDYTNQPAARRIQQELVHPKYIALYLHISASCRVQPV